jgi:hypothetical protein
MVLWFAAWAVFWVILLYDRNPDFWSLFWRGVVVTFPLWAIFLSEWWYGYL